MSFYNAVKLWNNVSDNDLVCSSDVKKLKKKYFDSVMWKFTEFFSFLNDLHFNNFSLSTLVLNRVNLSKFSNENFRIDVMFLAFLNLIFKSFITLILARILVF